MAAVLMDVAGRVGGRWVGVEARPEWSKEPRGLLVATTAGRNESQVPQRLQTEWTKDDTRYSDLFHQATVRRRTRDEDADGVPVSCPDDRLHTLDASVQYLYAGVHSPGAGGPERIAAVYRRLGLPLPKVMIAVRDPVSRVQSDVRYQRLGGELSDPVTCARSLHVATTALGNCVGLGWYWGPRYHACIGNWTKLLPPDVNATTAAFTGMLRNSAIDVFAARYASLWSPADVHLVSFDEWKANTTTALSKMLDFLQVDAEPSEVARASGLPVANVGPSGGPPLLPGCTAALRYFFSSLPRPS
jgi:hypothetical protein